MTTAHPPSYKVSRVACLEKGCRFRTEPGLYDDRWAEWRQHYLDVHYDPRWSVPCPRACGWTSLAASDTDHRRALSQHALSHEVSE